MQLRGIPGSWWDPLTHPWLFPPLPGTCTIRVLPRVETRGLSPKDVPELTESVRQAMAEALAEMSMSDHGDQDMEQPPLGPGKDRDSPQGQGDTTGNSK